MRSPTSTQSHLRYPLSRLFGSAGNVRVLRALADGLPASVSQIARTAGLSPQGTRLVLDGLVMQGIVIVRGSARTKLYELAAGHAFHRPILELFGAERSSWESSLARLRARLAGRPGVEAAWLYGSVARGEDGPASDIDVALLVTTSDVADEVRNDLMDFEDDLKTRVSIAALTSKELAALPEGDKWWTDVARDARILKGGSPEAEWRRARARSQTT